MRKHTLLAAVASTLLVAIPLSAQAQESYADVRIEPGVAFPVGSPQDDRFTPGGGITVKPEYSITDIFSLGVSGTFLAFGSQVADVGGEGLLGLGGFVRVKRPHGQEWNTSEGAAAASPWLDADLQYIRTGPLNRLGFAVGVGVSMPVDEDRQFWLGPMVRYQHVYQPDNLPPGRNPNDSHTIIVGLSLEIGEKHQKSVAPAKEEPQSQPAPQPAPTPVPAKPPVTMTEIDVEMTEVIQFAWDSDKLDDTAKYQLNEVVRKINNSTCFKAVETEGKQHSDECFKAIKVEGHASSEGQVQHNDKLSQRRANAVMEYLAGHGVPRAKLSAVGHGSRVPVATNANEAGRVKNRRAEFVVNITMIREGGK